MDEERKHKEELVKRDEERKHRLEDQERRDEEDRRKAIQEEEDQRRKEREEAAKQEYDARKRRRDARRKKRDEAHKLREEAMREREDARRDEIDEDSDFDIYGKETLNEAEPNKSAQPVPNRAMFLEGMSLSELKRRQDGFVIEPRFKTEADEIEEMQQEKQNFADDLDGYDYEPEDIRRLGDGYYESDPRFEFGKALNPSHSLPEEHYNDRYYYADYEP